MKTEYAVKPLSSYSKIQALFFSPYCKCGNWLKAFRSCERCSNCGAEIDWSTFYDDEHEAWIKHYDKLKLEKAKKR